ncbi:MAG: methyltransferase domain-containing protein [Alphaproteobacteria bacterium]|nr:methyltransferase domain-containing protein [Alphaproteobacteria bacterium]
MNRDIKTRKISIDVLFEVLHRKHTLDEAFEAAVGRDSESDFNRQDRAFIRNLTAVILRNLGHIDYLINMYLKRPVPRKNIKIKDVLRIGIAQLLFLDTASHAAVDTSVRLVEELGLGRYKGLVNAILRRLQRDADKDAELTNPKIKENIPEWLWNVWVDDYGVEVAEKIAKGSLREAPLDITVKENPDNWVEKLEGQAMPLGAVRLGYKRRLRELEGFEGGDWWVQDAAASMPVKLMSNVAGLNVLDMCAAPGGKTAQLAAVGVNVTAIDRSKKRLERLQDNIQRLGLLANVKAIASEAVKFCEDAENKNKFDAVLLDAPCSATGTIRRHPDLLYIKNENSLEGFPKAQRNLLATAQNVVRSGGEIIYCVCSIQKAEGAETINSVLKSNGVSIKRKPFTTEELKELMSSEFAELADEILTDEGDIRMLPYFLDDLGGMDGFFISRLVKE